MNKREFIKGLLTTAIAAAGPASALAAPLVSDPMIAFSPPDTCFLNYWIKPAGGQWEYFEHVLQNCGPGHIVKIYQDGQLLLSSFETDDGIADLYQNLRRRVEQGT